ncbi:hypothetical protein LTR01_008980 [Friedmanniomyces endolithicus]|nr:hypothetical protein LTR01_008980 [Friedmanniomyces endolithicus]
MTPTSDYANDSYTWESLTGWKSYRTLRPFRGMYWDVRRRLPYYWSDIRDGLTYRTFAGTIRIFFVNLLPALAFQLDMTRQTDGYFGTNEALFSSALAALVFSTLSCQPLTVVGITGLISLFNYTVFAITEECGIRELYPQFIAWVSIWAAITHWVSAICNWCDYMRYITDFSSNSFGMYVGIVYMVKGFQELMALYYESNPAAGFLGVVIALCYFFSIVMLEMIGSTTCFTPNVRKFVSDVGEAFSIRDGNPTSCIFVSMQSPVPASDPLLQELYPSSMRQSGVFEPPALDVLLAVSLVANTARARGELPHLDRTLFVRP